MAESYRPTIRSIRDGRASEQYRQQREREAQAWAIEKQRIAGIIRGKPAEHDPAKVRAYAGQLRQFIEQGKAAGRMPLAWMRHVEKLALAVVVDAFAAGAFDVPEWAADRHLLVEQPLLWTFTGIIQRRAGKAKLPDFDTAANLTVAADALDVEAARMKAAGKASAAVRHAKRLSDKAWLASAMMMVRDNPAWSDAKIAREVGKSSSTLTRSREYQAAATMARQKRTPHRGHVDRDSGAVEAYDDR